MIFSKWQSLENSPHFCFDSFKETLDGGQCFRWNFCKDKLSKEYFEGVLGKYVFRLLLNENNKIEFSSNLLDEQKAICLLQNHIGFEGDIFSKKLKQLAKKNDIILNEALENFKDLRILKLSPQEATISFICSSSKQIVQIKECVRLLCQNFGKKIFDNFYEIPSWEKLSLASLEDLKKCKLGYRASYIKKSASIILSEENFFENIEKLPYEKAKQKLKTLSGVGDKVADCILLFGFRKYEAFPVDTWIYKAMTSLYNLEGFSKQQVFEFAQKNFTPCPAIAQQLLFAKIRNKK